MSVLKCKKCNNAVSAGMQHQCRQMRDAGMQPVTVSSYGHSDLFLLVATTAILGDNGSHSSSSDSGGGYSDNGSYSSGSGSGGGGGGD